MTMQNTAAPKLALREREAAEALGISVVFRQEDLSKKIIGN